MNEKDFKRLGKGDLIEIIYQLKKNEEELRQKLDETEAQLKERNYKIENAGSIAEAALELNEVFASAQKAADEYLEQIHADNAGLEARCESMLAECEAKCAEREEETEAKCRAMEEEAEQDVSKKWETFQRRAEEYINDHAVLMDLLKTKDNPLADGGADADNTNGGE